jgi:hypothetical protein
MTIKEIPKAKRKEVNSIMILVSWELWKHRNNCVFNGLKPAVDLLLAAAAHFHRVLYVECCRSKWAQGVVTGLKPLVYSSICELGFLVGQSVYPLVYFLSFLINITCNSLARSRKNNVKSTQETQHLNPIQYNSQNLMGCLQHRRNKIGGAYNANSRD